MERLLSSKSIKTQLELFSEWQLNKKETELTRTFTFPSFVTALAFVAKVAVHAEVLNHHPEILLSYGKVKVTLTTHESKGLTKRDFELAKKIDQLKI